MNGYSHVATTLVVLSLIVVSSTTDAFLLLPSIQPTATTTTTTLIISDWPLKTTNVVHPSPFSLKATEDESSTSASVETSDKKPIILEPFPEAADPLYAVRGPVGEGTFVVSREGGPTKEELANENILKIVLSECTDLEVNTLVWKALGYRFDTTKEEWNASECFPNWREKYPTPPDLIGMQRIYAREIDQASLRSNQALVRSVPVDNKQSLKEHMKPLGWKGFQVRFSLCVRVCAGVGVGVGVGGFTN